MRRVALLSGGALVMAAWVVAASPLGMTGHMAAHMTVVAVAAPLLAWGLAGSRADPAEAWPRAVTPLAMSVVELAVVWGWHLPVLRMLAAASTAALMAEQASFLAAGLLLWSAVLGTRGVSSERRAAGVAALLLTSMHMTLLGALIGLAPRPLYTHAHGGGPAALADQQLGGVVMLMVGAASYFAGGLLMLGGLLRRTEAAA